jgi:hypothetical protein
MRARKTSSFTFLYGATSFAFFSNNSSQPSVSASEIVFDRRNSSGGLPQ